MSFVGFAIGFFIGCALSDGFALGIFLGFIWGILLADD
jgi:hypothetical protein